MNKILKLTKLEKEIIITNAIELMRKRIVGTVNDIVFSSPHAEYLSSTTDTGEVEVEAKEKSLEAETMSVSIAVETVLSSMKKNKTLKDKNLEAHPGKKDLKQMYYLIMQELNKKSEPVVPDSRLHSFLQEKMGALQDEAEILMKLANDILVDSFHSYEGKDLTNKFSEGSRILMELAKIEKQIQDIKCAYKWLQDKDDSVYGYNLEETYHGGDNSVSVLEHDDEDETSITWNKEPTYTIPLHFSRSESELLSCVPSQIMENGNIIPERFEWSPEYESSEGKKSSNIQDYPQKYYEMCLAIYHRKLTIYFYAKNYLEAKKGGATEAKLILLRMHLPLLRDEIEICTDILEKSKYGIHIPEEADMENDSAPWGAPSEKMEEDVGEGSDDGNSWEMEEATGGSGEITDSVEDLRESPTQDEGLCDKKNEDLSTLQLRLRVLIEKRNEFLEEYYLTPNIESIGVEIAALSAKIYSLGGNTEEPAPEDESILMINIKDFLNEPEPFKIPYQRILAEFTPAEEDIVQSCNIADVIGKDPLFNGAFILNPERENAGNNKEHLELLLSDLNEILHSKYLFYYHATEHVKRHDDSTELEITIGDLGSEIDYLIKTIEIVQNRLRCVDASESARFFMVCGEVGELEEKRFNGLVDYMQDTYSDENESADKKESAVSLIIKIISVLQKRYEEEELLSPENIEYTILDMPAIEFEELALLKYVPEQVQSCDRDSFTMSFKYSSNKNIPFLFMLDDQEKKILARTSTRMLMIYFFAQIRIDEIEKLLETGGMQDEKEKLILEKQKIVRLCRSLKIMTIRKIRQMSGYENIGRDQEPYILRNQLYNLGMGVHAEIDGIYTSLKGENSNRLAKCWYHLQSSMREFCYGLRQIERGKGDQIETSTDAQIRLLQNKHDVKIQTTLQQITQELEQFNEDIEVGKNLELMKRKVTTIREEIFGEGKVIKGSGAAELTT